MKSFISFLPALLFLAACGESGNLFQKPSVSLTSAQLQDVRTSDATAVFNLKIDNPNPFGVKVRGLTYQLSFNNRPKFLSGKLESGLDIPAQGSAPLAVPISFSYGDVLLSVADIVRERGANYELKGTIDTGIFVVPYQVNGKLTYQ